MPREIKSPTALISSSKSWDGKHTIEFNEGSHRYKLDGKAAVGTTTFIKSSYPTSMGLISWMKGITAEALFSALTVPGDGGYMPRADFWPIHEETKKELIKVAKIADRSVAQEAADIGTICHGFAELHSLGKVYEAAALLDRVRGAASWPLIVGCVQKYLAWSEANRSELMAAEGLVASAEFLFCGKFDRLDRVNGKVILRDYKTSKDIFLEQFIQLGAYSLAIKEWTGIDVDGLEVLRFGKDDGAFETLLIDDPEEVMQFQAQAIRCRETYEFAKFGNDARFKWEPK